MTSRKEKAIQRKLARRKRVVTISLIAGGIVTALAVFLTMYLSAGRQMTSIEKVVSENTDALFISKVADETTWNYFMYISGYNFTPIEGVERVGFAHDDNKNFLYLTGDTEKIKEALSENKVEYGEKDGVIGIGEEGHNFSDAPLSENTEYKELATDNGNNTTFAYANFEEFSAELPESYGYALPKLSKWVGSFANNEWTGPVTGVDMSAMDETKKMDEVNRNQMYRDFADSSAYSSEDDDKWSIYPVSLGLLADKQYSTAIQKIDFKLSGDSLSLTIKQEE